jgi:arylsulfatase A-like enzyme
MKITLKFLILICFFVSCNKVSQDHAINTSKPNVVLIMVDDMGWSDIGCYGSEIKTPHLDKLAHEGIRFTQFHNTSKCFPSRACLLTGLYAQQCGLGRSSNAKIKNAITLGELMRSAGYQTFMTGKHHGLDNMYDRGFDRYYGLRDGAGNHFNMGHKREGEAKPAQKRPARRVWCFDDKVVQPYKAPKDFYTTDYFTKWAIDFLDKRNKKKPFFLYVSYTAPHDPLQAWPKDIKKYKGKYSKGYAPIAKARFDKQRKLGLTDKSFPKAKAMHVDWASLSKVQKKDQEQRMEVYAAMVDCVDQNVGKLITKIKDMGEWENSLFMFTSDNGSSAENVNVGKGEIGSIDRWSSVQKNWANVHNTPFRYYKNNSFQGGICTPFIVHWPNGIKNKNRIDTNPWHFVDVMATLVDLTKAKYPKEYKSEKVLPYVGESFMSVVKEEKIKERKNPIFWQWAKGRAVREGQWKLVSGSKKWELYDMSNDKTETNNLAEKNPALVKKLSVLYQDWFNALKK